ncbi:MAG: heme-binding protein [Acetobacteraceae bacterium]|nr:heme-binding protein [Acetobacteraceae bacterium]
MLARLTTLLAGASLAACSVIGVRGAEEPRYQVVERVGAVEVRQYGPRIAAETAVPGGEMDARYAGFRRLADYIFGDNRSRAEIAMTAPVAQQKQTIAMTAPVAQARDAAGQWVIRFFMPAKYTMETLPQPLNPAVRLVAVPGETVAVLRFSGSTAPEAVATRQDALLRALADSTWRPEGTPVAWFYDPPWTLPPFRRNEVAVPVARR